VTQNKQFSDKKSPTDVYMIKHTLKKSYAVLRNLTLFWQFLQLKSSQNNV